MSFDESLARVLDPEGLHWCYPGDDADDPSQVRLIEVRIDTPNERVSSARSRMEQEGWQLASQPDDASDPIQRLYFRKLQSLLPHDRTKMLTTALQAAYDADGKFWSWLNRREDD